MSADSKVILFPSPAPFVLELHSERFVDAMVALQQAGYKISYIKDSVNRYRIEDEEELK